jgi:hypothetical protein
MKKVISLVAIIFVSSFSLVSHAAYLYRNGGMLYDSDRNVTWLMDLNYNCTSNPNCTVQNAGRMTWSGAQQFASNLVYQGISGWRLPSAKLVGNDVWTNDGSSDRGYNNVRSDMGSLWYGILGNKGYCDTAAIDIATDCPQSGWGLLNKSVADSLTDISYSFTNFNSGPFWTLDSNPDDPTLGFYFNTTRGYQNYELPKTGKNFVALLADGDVAQVATVPLPASLWFFSSSLCCLFYRKKF